MKSKYFKLFGVSLILSIMMIGLVTPLQFWASSPPTTYWKFNENNFSVPGSMMSNDTLGLRNLTLDSNGSSLIQGKLGNAFSMNRTINTVLGNTTGGSMFAFDTGNFTIAFWFNSSSPLTSYQAVETKQDEGGWAISILSNGTLAFSNSNLQVGYTKYSVGNGTWQRVVFTREGTGANQFRAWVNGTNTANYTFSTNITNSTAPLVFRSMGQFIMWDDFQITKGYAWNSSDINYDWNNGLGREADIPPSEVGVILDSPSNNSNFVTPTILFSSTSTPTSINITNATIFIYNSTSLFNRTNISMSSSSNYSNFSISNFQYGTYFWNIYVCGINNNASGTTSCAIGSSNRTITLNPSKINSGFNSYSYETATELFQTNITLLNNQSISSVLFYYNGTTYIGSSSLISGNNYSLTKSIDIPTSAISSNTTNWFFGLNLNTGNFNLSTENQSVAGINLSICGALPQNRPYINFTFKNETSAQESINAFISSSTWSYYLGSGTVNKSLSYSDATERSSFAFCFSPINRTLNVDLDLIYDNSESQSRTYSPAIMQLNNITTNRTLYLLPTSLGSIVTFQVVNSAQQVIEGVSVNVTHPILGLVATGTTDAAGLVTFFLDPTTTYSFTFSKTGLASQTQSIAPSQGQYTITMGGGEVEVIPDLAQGVSYTISPTSDFLDRNVTYNFSFTISSDYWNLEQFGYSLYYGNNTLIETETSTTSTGGTLTSLNVPMYNTTSISMNYFYIVNGTTVNNTRVWYVQSTDGRDFSIFQFVEDLNRYLSANMFGLDNFGKSLIAVLILVLVTGVLGYRYGIASESAIMGIIFGVVLILDTIGIIPTRITVGNLTSVEHFIPFVAGLILVSIIIREELR